MLNMMKSRMFLMVIIALAGFGAYTLAHNIIGKNQSGGGIAGNTGNPLVDYDIATVKGWFNADCFWQLYDKEYYGKGKPNQICIKSLIENVKQATGQDITQEQILDPKVHDILVKRY